MSYQVVNLRRLGLGGNGDVYVGQRSDNGANVVVKYLREAHLPHARRAFAREVRILGRKLRGMVPLLFADTAGKHPYYVMPYLRGGALTQYAGRLTEHQLQAVAMDLARTLANIHIALEAHGDVKPDNILLGPDGTLQVADPLGNGTVFTMLFSENRGGTPGYWAPEIRSGASISRAGDVYSYGATLYHLLTGRRPQDGQRIDPSSEGYVNAPTIREVIAACCRTDPRMRPSMQDVLRMLHGEKWADIQAARNQRQQFVAACIIGGILWFAAAAA